MSEDDGEGDDLETEESFGVLRPLATRRSMPSGFSKSVRARTGARTETTAEGESTANETQQELQESRPWSSPAPWPSLRDSLDDLLVSLRQHFARQRAEADQSQADVTANTGIVEMQNGKVNKLWNVQPMGSRKRFVSFMSQRFEETSDKPKAPSMEEKRADKTLNYEYETAEMKLLIDEARRAEWSKYIKYSAAVPLEKEQAEHLVKQRHAVIPSKWVDVDKMAHKAHEPDYIPKIKSRLVSCGNFEDQGSLGTDAPTSDMETHHIVAAWAASHGLQLNSADIASAYFQATSLDRVVIMKQPRSGLPDMDPSVMLLVRVPVYGLCDSGRGFWKCLDGEAKDVGFVASEIFPAFYFLRSQKNEMETEAVAVLTTHVDDLLFAYPPEGESVVEGLLGKFDMGTRESKEFRHGGNAFEQTESAIRINVSDNTRRIRPINIPNGRRNDDVLTRNEETQLRSVVGSLSWVARQGRPQLLFLVPRLQSEVKGATVQVLRDANKAVQIAHAGLDDIYLNFPCRLMKWSQVGVLSVSDASFANEPGMKSQQGRCRFLVPVHQLKSPDCCEFDVYPVSFSSTTIK